MKSGNSTGGGSGRGRRPDGMLPVEVKYQARVRRQDTMTIRNSFGEGLLLSKQQLDLDGPVRIVPLALFLYMME